LFDSHCHLTDERFRDDLDSVIERAWRAGLEGIVTIASDADDVARALAIATAHDRIWCTAGIHPHVAAAAREGDPERVRVALAHERVVALGETGLDYHYDHSPRDVQRSRFAWHLTTAHETGYPVVVHSRAADADTAALIREYPGVSGVLHCFSGGRELFDVGLAAGWYISFAGLITFRKFAAGDLVAATPADRLLLETDSPYLAPVPYRGHRNEPAYVAETWRAAAHFRDELPEVTARLAADNARRFYRLMSVGAAGLRRDFR
jgi:TatD DNase family protein